MAKRNCANCNRRTHVWYPLLTTDRVLCVICHNKVGKPLAKLVHQTPLTRASEVAGDAGVSAEPHQLNLLTGWENSSGDMGGV